MSRRRKLWAPLFILMGSVLATAATAQSGPEKTKSTENPFYLNKTITLVVNWRPGTTADTLARLIQNTWRDYIPGRPRIVVANREGASGLVAANFLHNVAKPDGLTIGVFSPSGGVRPSAQFLEDGADYDIRNYRPIMSLQSDTAMWWIRGDAPYSRLKDAIGQGSAGGPRIVVGNSGECAASTIKARRVAEWLDLPFDMVYGLSGARQLKAQGLERGDFVMTTAQFWHTMTKSNPGWLADKFIKPFALEHVPGALPPDVFDPNDEIALPSDMDSIFELLTAEQQKMFRAIAVDSLGPFQRGIFAPPRTPNDRVDILRQAAMEMAKNPKFVSEATRLTGGDVLEMRPGAEMEALYKEVIDEFEEFLPRFYTEVAPECAPSKKS